MATEHTHHRIESPDASRGYTVRRIEGASHPLPPRTDQELEAMRAAHPDQAWFWTRAFYDSERAAESERGTGGAPVFYGDEEFEAALRARARGAENADV